MNAGCPTALNKSAGGCVLPYMKAAISCWMGLCLALSAALSWADNYAYVTRGESGEILFTDQALDDAQRVSIGEYDTAPSNSSEQVALMLEVAGQLRSARLAREASRERIRRERERVSLIAPPPPPRDNFIPRFGFGGFFPPFGPPPVTPKPPPKPTRPITRSRFRPSLD